MASAGRINIHVSIGGYPAWAGLEIDGVQVARFHHRELSDLKYAAEKAMQEARMVLKGFRNGEENEV